MKIDLIKTVIKICLFLLLFFTPVFAANQDVKVGKKQSIVQVEARVDKNAVFIGDKIKYTIVVQAKDSVEVELPKFADNLAGFAIRDFGSSEKKFFRKITYQQWYVLDTYTSGKYTIPKTVVKYKLKGRDEWQEIETDEVEIEVKSVLEKAKNAAEIRDIKGPVRFPRKISSYLIGGLLVLVIISGLVIYLARKKKKNEIIPPPPAHEIAYRDLEILRQEQLVPQGRIKEYHQRLSDIIRHYLENRFELRAPEMTTEEFLIKVKDANTLSIEQKGLLRTFLSHCDLVKFAEYGPTETEIDASYDSARVFVEQTKEVIF
ncbi:MAG: hypothetical protein ABH952_06325 [Candidatus Omnitrophota bacterium]